MITLPRPAHLYYGLIETWTTPTDRLVFPDHGVPLPDGQIAFELQSPLRDLLDPLLLPGESYADAIERLCAVAEGHIS